MTIHTIPHYEHVIKVVTYMDLYSIFGKTAVILATLEAIRWLYMVHRLNYMAINIEKIASALKALEEDLEDE